MPPTTAPPPAFHRRCARCRKPAGRSEARANASPQLERTINRFYAISDAGRPCRVLVGASASPMPSRATSIAAATSSPPSRRWARPAATSSRLRHAGDRLAAIGSVIGLCRRRGHCPSRSSDCSARSLPLPVVPALASGRARAVVRLWPFDRARVRLWPARPGADVPVAALFRKPWRAAFIRPRWRYLALMALVIALLIGLRSGSLTTSASPPCSWPPDRGIRAAARHCRGPDGAGTPAAARRITHAAAGDRKHLPAGRADTVGGACRSASGSPSSSPSPRSRQSAPAVSGRACRDRAPSVLLHRYSTRKLPLRRLPETDHAGLDGRGRSDAARAHCRRPAVSRPKPSRPRRTPNGAAERPRLTYTGEIPKGSQIVEGEWWGADYTGPPLSRWRRRSPTG